jgi:hypothetical protein
METFLLIKILIFVTKSDVLGSMDVPEIAQAFKLGVKTKKRDLATFETDFPFKQTRTQDLRFEWRIQACSTRTEKGQQAILEGLRYLIGTPKKISSIGDLDQFHVRQSCVVYTPFCCGKIY